MKHGKILEKAHEIINGERQKTYGNPKDSLRVIGDYWTIYIKNNLPVIKGTKVTITPKMVAEMMMLLKIARMNGSVASIDNYIDLAGYAGIAGDMIPVAPCAPPTPPTPPTPQDLTGDA